MPRDTIFDEGALRFIFDENWHVLKWDAHRAFLSGIHKLEGSKAVDFLGVHVEDPMFIEVKDFRGYHHENKERLSTGDLVREVAAKVRDSLAGLIWACDRDELDEGELRLLVEKLMCRGVKVRVVLLLEEDRALTPPSASALGESIRRGLKWLNPKVIVASQSLLADKPLSGLSVRNLLHP